MDIRHRYIPTMLIMALLSSLCYAIAADWRLTKLRQKHFKSKYNELYEKELDPVCKKITTILGAKPVKY